MKSLSRTSWKRPSILTSQPSSSDSLEEQQRIAYHLDVPPDLLFAEPKTPAQARRLLRRLCERSPVLRQALGVPSPYPRWPWHSKGSHAYQRRRELAQWRTRLVRLACGKRLPRARRPRQPNLLKLVRAVRRQSYRQLASESHVSLVKVWRIENDLLRPEFAEMHELARALGVHAEPLFCLGHYADVNQALNYLMQFAPFKRRWVVRMVEALRRQLATPRQAASGRQSAGAGSG